MPEKNKQFLDENGLQRYHQGVINALNDKAAKKHVHIGGSQPTSSDITVWFDTNVDYVQDDVLVLSDSNQNEEEELILK